MDELNKRIIEALSDGPKSPSELAQITGRGIVEIFDTLTLMIWEDSAQVALGGSCNVRYALTEGQWSKSATA